MKYIVVGIVFVAACVIAAWWGHFSQSFSDGLCYSNVIDSIAKLSKQVTAQGDTKQRADFDAALSNIPVRGYESDCGEIQKYWRGVEIEFQKRITTDKGGK